MNTVSQEQVNDNMKDVIVKTVIEFNKPVTYVTVRMKNGFTVRESTTCVDPKNYNEEIGKKICLEKIEDKIWFLLGYALQDKLSNTLPIKQKLIIEKENLDLKISKLTSFITGEEVSPSLSKYHIELLIEQLIYMKSYSNVLKERIEDL